MPATNITQAAALNTMLDAKAALEESKAAMRTLHVAFLVGSATTNDVRTANRYMQRDQAAYDKALSALCAANKTD